MLNNDELVKSFIQIKLKQPDDFLKVRETLTRIGVASARTRTLFQSVHILHKRGKYYLCHFKQLFMLDGKDANFDENDRARLNTIANMLATWKLVELVEPEKSASPTVQMYQIRVLAHAEKSMWELVPKYRCGNVRKSGNVERVE